VPDTPHPARTGLPGVHRVGGSRRHRALRRGLGDGGGRPTPHPLGGFHLHPLGHGMRERAAAHPVRLRITHPRARLRRGSPVRMCAMKTKKYEKELSKLHVELCHLQSWVKEKGLRVVIIFEGRDGAGKGGTIKALTERVSPRVFRVVALPAPSDREKGQLYMQRYVQQLPAKGEVLILDRSWYNRAGVELVMGFCTKEQHEQFLEVCPQIEKFLVDGGIILIKLWLEVSDEEQKKRFQARIEDPRRQWK